MPGKRRIAVITGSRAEYGLLRSVMQAVRARRELRLQVIVTGMHLLKRFGHTIRDVQADGFRIDARVAMHRDGDSRLGQAQALARGVAGLAQQLDKLGSDVAVVLGDRVEALAGALAAATTGRILAHIHGGDVAPGDLDDSFRHAITKLAHIHFAATPDAAKRLVKLGERRANVHVVGAPGLDELLRVRRPGKRWLTDRYGFDPGSDVALIVQHPIGRPARVEQRTMSNLLRATKAGGLSGLIVFPNSDPGHSGIIRSIEQHLGRNRDGCWVGAASLPRTEFLECLKAVRVLIGNSSAGIIEAHSAGTPVVNVGPRQDGRLRSAGSVLDSGERISEIQSALARALRTRIRRSSGSAYGSGGAGRKMATILARTPLSDNLTPKRISY